MYSKYHPIVRGLLNFVNLDLNIKDENHKTALMYAVEKAEIVKLLLSQPNIDIKAKTAWSLAISSGMHKLVEAALNAQFEEFNPLSLIKLQTI